MAVGKAGSAGGRGSGIGRRRSTHAVPGGHTIASPTVRGSGGTEPRGRAVGAVTPLPRLVAPSTASRRDRPPPPPTRGAGSRGEVTSQGVPPVSRTAGPCTAAIDASTSAPSPALRSATTRTVSSSSAAPAITRTTDSNDVRELLQHPRLLRLSRPRRVQEQGEEE